MSLENPNLGDVKQIMRDLSRKHNSSVPFSVCRVYKPKYSGQSTDILVTLQDADYPAEMYQEMWTLLQEWWDQNRYKIKYMRNNKTHYYGTIVFATGFLNRTHFTRPDSYPYHRIGNYY